MTCPLLRQYEEMAGPNISIFRGYLEPFVFALSLFSLCVSFHADRSHPPSYPLNRQLIVHCYFISVYVIVIFPLTHCYLLPTTLPYDAILVCYDFIQSIDK